MKTNEIKTLGFRREFHRSAVANRLKDIVIAAAHFDECAKPAHHDNVEEFDDTGKVNLSEMIYALRNLNDACSALQQLATKLVGEAVNECLEENGVM